MNNRVFYIGLDGLLTLTRTTKTISEDEPVFILRARDRQALSTIRVYQSTMPPTSEGWKIIQAVIDDFVKFKQENGILMGTPSDVY